MERNACWEYFYRVTLAGAYQQWRKLLHRFSSLSRVWESAIAQPFPDSAPRAAAAGASADTDHKTVCAFFVLAFVLLLLYWCCPLFDGVASGLSPSSTTTSSSFLSTTPTRSCSSSSTSSCSRWSRRSTARKTSSGTLSSSPTTKTGASG